LIVRLAGTNKIALKETMMRFLSKLLPGIFHKQKPRIGLALGGGGALGAAHIGVLKAFAELNIPVHAVTGTSIGALVGGLYAFGKSCEELEEIALDMSWMEVAGITLSRFGILSNSRLYDLVGEQLNEVRIENATIPFAAIATDIASGEKVILDSGWLHEAVAASTCIPGVFVPIELNGRMLVDGGIVENVPLSPLRGMGADFLIAVDLNGKWEPQRPEGIIDVLSNSFHFTFQAATNAIIQQADLVIQPELTGFGRTDMGNAEALIEAGYKSAMEAVQGLKRLK